MEITLGPVLFDWSKDAFFEFYDSVCDMDVDRVYIGEVICVKKKGLKIKDIDKISAKLESAGKKVVLSTLGIMSNEKELALARAVVGRDYTIEANDMGVFNMIDGLPDGGTKKDVTAGPLIINYNKETISVMSDMGVSRVVFPVELKKESIVHNMEAVTDNKMTYEIFAHGKAPLAFSWKCYTLKSHGLIRGQCENQCAMDPDGMELKSLDGTPTFTINGTSILSAFTYSLVEFVEDIKQIGINALRISPHYQHTGKIVDVYRRRIDGKIDGAEGVAELKDTSPQGFCNGYYVGGAGKDYITAEDYKNNNFQRSSLESKEVIM